MRILHLTSHLDIGGITSYVLSLSSGLVERGHRVVIVSGGGQLEPHAATLGVEHWTVPLHTSVEFSPQVFWATRTLWKRLRQEPCDLLHAHTRVGQVAAATLARLHRVPYVTTWHGFFRRNLGRRLWPCTGAVTIAISEPVRQHLLRDFRVQPERVHLIAHGIDPVPFESPVDALAQQRLRERLRLPGDGPLVGTVARLVPSRHVEELVTGFASVRAAVPTARLLIVGDGPERARLKALASHDGLGGVVHFAGSLPETRVALSLMSVFVFLPAEQEGFGLALLEAMASGRPIVAVRRGGGAVWVLDQGGVGLTVESGDPASLAAAVVRLLQDGQAASQEGSKARAIVKERYTLTRMLDQVEALYQHLVPPGS
jgi:glycosyltransferase involved in cell wall biosynthesis